MSRLERSKSPPASSKIALRFTHLLGGEDNHKKAKGVYEKDSTRSKQKNDEPASDRA